MRFFFLRAIAFMPELLCPGGTDVDEELEVVLPGGIP